MNEFNLNDFKISKSAKKKLNDKNWLKKELADGKTAQEILEFSDEVMAEFYGAAHHLFQKEKFGDAINAFLFLVTLNPKIFEYWLGLGMALQVSGKFDEAIDAFEMAALTEPENPVSYFYLAKCYYSLNEPENALRAIEVALEFAEESEDEYEELKCQAMSVQELLRKKK